MVQQSILNEIIRGYRNLIHDRYQYSILKDKVDIPDFISEEVIVLIRDYFLNYIYPEQQKREELNEAFESLDSYIKNPEKLLNMLFDSFRLLFSHGSKLPKIFNTGFNALRSFRSASSFENKLAKEAENKNVLPPYTKEKILGLFSALDRKEIESFIQNSESLIYVFQDGKLVGNIIEILQYLIQKMKKKKRLYTESEVRGMEIGLDMLIEGRKLFDKFDAEQQKHVIQLIIQNERSILDTIVFDNP